MSTEQALPYSHTHTIPLLTVVEPGLVLFNSLQTGTCQEHLSVTQQQQQGHLPSASAETEACAAAAADLQHPPREFRVESGHSVLQGI